jgi:hypothetical protein
MIEGSLIPAMLRPSFLGPTSALVELHLKPVGRLPVAPDVVVEVVEVVEVVRVAVVVIVVLGIQLPERH